MGMKIKCIECGKRIKKNKKRYDPVVMEHEPFCSEKCVKECRRKHDENDSD